SSRWMAHRRLCNAPDRATAQHAPGANSGGTDGIDTGRISPLYWLAHKYRSRGVRAWCRFPEPFRNALIQPAQTATHLLKMPILNPPVGAGVAWLDGVDPWVALSHNHTHPRGWRGSMGVDPWVALVP